jgi:hypothetical protein
MQVPGGLLICVLLLCYHMACRTLVTVCTSRDKGSSAVASKAVYQVLLGKSTCLCKEAVDITSYLT